MTVKTKKILTRSALVFLALIVLGLTARGILNFTTGKRLESAIREMKTQGKRLSVRDFAPKCKDIDNAALLWQGIESIFVKDFNSPATIGAPWERLREGRPFEPSMKARIEEAAKKYETIFFLIRQAADKPCFRYARRWQNASFSLKRINLNKIAPVLRLFLLNAYLLAEKGNLDQAIQDCRAGIRTISFFMNEPHPFNRFFSLILSYENLDMLYMLFLNRQIDERSCQAILAELDRLRPQESLRLSFQMERAMALEEYSLYLRGDFRGGLMDKAAHWLFKPLLKSEALFALNLWNDAEKALNEPFYGPQKWFNLYQEKREKIPGPYRLARIYHSSIGFWIRIKYTRLETMIDITRVALACRLHFLRHGQFPETLQQLAPEHLTEIPVDPFTGRSLIYQRTKKGFIVYSLGPNQKDDGGQGTWGWEIKTGDDIAWKE